MNRTTETLFLRIDPALARTVKQLALSLKVSISAWSEDALRARVNESTSGDHRAKLLQATEEALISRVDARLHTALRNVQGLYAKEALDVALMLELMKQLLASGFRDDRQLKAVLQGARQEAHRRISQRNDMAFPLPPEYEAKLTALQQENRALKQETADLEAKVQNLEGRCAAHVKGQDELRRRVQEVERVAEAARWKEERVRHQYAWATEQYEKQGLLKRKSLSDFVAEYRG